MRKESVVCLLLLLGGFIFSLRAQTDNKSDSVKQIKESSLSNSRNPNVKVALSTDSLMPAEKEKVAVLEDSVIFNKSEFKPNPTKAVIYSAIFPGLGQIYNRKYWKLPLVYGGFVGLSYAISWNGGMYRDYAQAYQDLVTGNGTSWKDFVPNPNLSESEIQGLIPKFKRQKDYFRRNRDLAIICTVAFYGLVMLDAYVDAQLYDFDISPDLSMRVEPIMYQPTMFTKRTFGLQCSINF
ncbi:DUF5683 domain-containing protein [Dysgonomonas sp. ZJ709]|uniref:DUF5683 domain-containing protein n=1 Tax=Dysgonomonas sp. ZJ709 TaxID=2709797 RepID=UPI0013E9FACB|nr:DUF5683 domain-containing protein [Dysgonomonas sp. ZJ709]